MPDWSSPGAYERLMAALSGPPLCDDCHEEYEGPVYYTIGDAEEDYSVHEPDELTLGVQEPCTGNLCPDCAGPYLDPDDPDDPRRPKE